MFDEVDKDKNGSVTLEELKLKMMPAVTREDIKHFVQVKTDLCTRYKAAIFVHAWLILSSIPLIVLGVRFEQRQNSRQSWVYSHLFPEW